MSKCFAAWIFALLVAVLAGTARADDLVEARTLRPDQYLHFGQNLAVGCRYRLTFRPDGNLILTDHFGTTHWQSNTAGRGRYVKLGADGDFGVFDWAGNAIWHTNTWMIADPARVELQTDRNLVLYDRWGTFRWASNTVNRSTIGVSIQPCNWRAAKTNMWAGWDTIGSYLTHANMNVAGVDNAAVCANWCASNPQCAAYTYVPAGRQGPKPVCWQKSTLDGWVPDSGLTSGTVDRYRNDDGNQ